MPERKRITLVLSAFLATTLVHWNAAAQKPTGRDAQTAESDHGFYTAMWRAGAEPAILQLSEDPPSFDPPRGFGLDDVEVWIEEGERKFLGVFRPVKEGRFAESEKHPLVGPVDEAGFAQARAQQQSARRCLTGFELWHQQGKTLFAGVFATNRADPGCRGERFETGLSAIEFEARLQAYSSSHHLVDFEAVMDDGLLRISGLWHRGAEKTPTFALLGVDWETFHAWIHDLTTDGYALADLDIEFEPRIHRDGTEHDDDRTRAVVSGLWRAGKGMDWLGADYAWDQLDCAHKLLGSGFEDSGIDSGDIPALCDEHDEDDRPSAPGAPLQFSFESGQALRLVTLEVTSTSINPCWEGCPTRSHGAPMHNSWTIGPP